MSSQYKKSHIAGKRIKKAACRCLKQYLNSNLYQAETVFHCPFWFKMMQLLKEEITLTEFSFDKIKSNTPLHNSIHCFCCHCLTMSGMNSS